MKFAVLFVLLLALIGISAAQVSPLNLEASTSHDNVASVIVQEQRINPTSDTSFMHLGTPRDQGRNPLDQGGDNCASAVGLTGIAMPITITGTTVGYVNNYSTAGLGVTRPANWYGSYLDNFFLTSPDVVYSLTVPQTGYYRISTCYSSYSAALLVYQNTCPTEPANPGDFLCGAFQNCGNTYSAEVYTPLLSIGQSILIVVDGSTDEDEGVYELDIEQQPSQPLAGNSTIHYGQNNLAYIAVPNSVSLSSPDEAVTIEGWVWATSNSSQEILLAKGNVNINSSLSWKLRLNQNRTLQMFNRQGGSVYFTNSPTGIGELALRGWDHIAVVATSADNGTHKYYINGNIVFAQSNLGFSALSSTSDSLFIGGATLLPNVNFSGSLDEVRIWNRERTAQEILANMNSRLTASDSNLVGYWRMDEGTGITTADLSGNGNTGYLTGDTYFTLSMARIFDYVSTGLSVFDPNGSEVWLLDSVKQISWTSTGLPQVDISIDRSFPSGSWETIATGVVDSGSYEWQVAGPMSLNARIRVLATSNPTDGDTSDGDFTIVSVDSLPGEFDNVLPANSTFNASTLPTLSWLTSGRATQYDLYIWPDTTIRPQNPTANSLASTQYSLPSPLNFGQTYSWQVAAKNVYSTTWGPTWSFVVATLPDLVVSNVQVPPTAFSGQSVQVSWTVTNTGNNATSVPQWYDALYLSPSDSLDPNLATPLVSEQNATYLPSGEGYQNSYTFTLPNGIGGDYYIFVDADAGGHQFESDEENNLSRNMSPWVVSIAPYPDLRVNAIVAQSSAFNTDTVSVFFTVENIGTAPATGNWYDAVYLSDDDQVDGSDTLLATQFLAGPPMYADSFYESTILVVIPRFIYGTFYLIAVSDVYDHIYEFASNANNQLGSDSIQVFLTPQPDLTTWGVGVPESGNSGQSISVSWSVTNDGLGDPFGSSWNDRIYLSDAGSLGAGTTYTLGTRLNTQMIEPGDSYSKSKTVTLPNGISGAHYVFVKSDADSQIFEFNGSFTAETNNTSASGVPISVSLSPWPDLIVTQFTSANSVTAGSSMSITYRVENQGDVSTGGTSWTDRIYLSTNPVWSDQTSTLLASVTRNTALESNGHRDTTITVTIPTLAAGDRVLHVWTDATNVLYEHTDESNNTYLGPEILVEAYPPVDLSATVLTTPSSASSGQAISVGWTVQNIGSAQTLASSWQDEIYMSLDQTLTPETDILIANVRRNGVLSPSASYSKVQDLTIPNGMSGSYFCIVETDANAENVDVIPSNNIRVSNSPVAISLSASPNFTILSFVAIALSIPVNYSLALGQLTTQEMEQLETMNGTMQSTFHPMLRLVRTTFCWDLTGTLLMSLLVVTMMLRQQ